MGHEDVECEARGGVSINNWLLARTRRITIDASASADPPAVDAAAIVRGVGRSASRTVPALVAGAAALVLPLLLRSAAVNAPPVRAATETALTLFALSAARLLQAQFSESGRLRDLLLLCASLGLGLTTLSVSLPAALDLHAGGYFAAASLWGQLFVAAAFAAAAVVPSRAALARRRHYGLLGAGVGLGVPATAILGGLVSSALGVDPTAHPGVMAHGIAVGAIVSAAALLVYAAMGFLRRHIREADTQPLLLATAAFLLAGAALSRLGAQSLADGRVGIGVGLRVTASGLILAVALTLERRVRTRVASAAALAERRRVARDLHDGLAQDLAFIAAHGEQIAGELGEEHPVVVAARRALAISRRTISDLADPPGASAAEALHAVAQELRERFDVAIAVNAEFDDRLPARVREHLSRITREAIANAARHGQARNVLVSLREVEPGIALRVLDDGCGIPTSDSGGPDEGFGLRSMRERAQSLGGSLTVRRMPQGGTELEVVLP
jgi:signal transduction histidine kinase